MAKPFPNHPNLIDGFAPIQMECDAPDLIVDGEVPRDLNGTFYRNGPNPQFAPRGHHHWFGGDGMVHAFTLHDGTCRPIATAGRAPSNGSSNTKPDEALFAAFNPMESDPNACASCRPTASRTRTSSGMAASCSRSKKVTRRSKWIRTRSKSIGAWTFDGKLVGPMTAHPKMDPETGEMVFFGYNADGSDLARHVVPRRRPQRQADSIRDVHRAVRGDGARLHGDARSRDLSDHAANGFDGARDAGRDRSMHGSLNSARRSASCRATARQGSALVQRRSGVRLPSDERAYRRRHRDLRRVRVRGSAAVSAS